MKNDIVAQVQMHNRASHRRRVWHRVVTTLACLVVFVTTYALILPAITLESTPDTYCGQTEHTHTNACYEIPGVPEHTIIDCPVQRELYASAADEAPQIIHQHDSFCFGSSGELLCTLPEVREEDAPNGVVHQHTPECLVTIPAVAPEGLICTIPEHVHTADCLNPEKWGVQPDGTGSTADEPDSGANESGEAADDSGSASEKPEDIPDETDDIPEEPDNVPEEPDDGALEDEMLSALSQALRGRRLSELTDDEYLALRRLALADIPEDEQALLEDDEILSLMQQTLLSLGGLPEDADEMTDDSEKPLLKMTGEELFALTDEEISARTDEFSALTAGELETLNQRMAALVQDMPQTEAFSLYSMPVSTFAATDTDLSSATLVIQDEIASTGRYTLSLNGGDAQAGGQVSYRWYRTKANGTREAVARSFYRNADGTTSSNLGPSGSYLYLALDGGGVTDAVSSVEYEAVLVLNGTETSVNASITNTDYNKSVLNGSFERPQNDGASSQYEQGYTGLEWRTTATDNKIEIVRLTNQTLNSWRYSYSYSYRSGWWSSYVDVWPVDGNQYAEINAEQDSALYQSVLTVPGTTMNWQLYHAQRPGCGYKIGRDKDTMYLCIVSDTRATQYFSNTESLRSHVKQVLGNAVVYDADGLYIEKISDGTTWGKYTGTYTVPEGQYLTRFFFLSEEYTGGGLAGNPTLGNFLDNVWFSQELPDPSPNEATITLHKTVRGDLTAEHRAELSSRLSFEIRDASSGEVLLTIPASALGDWQQNGTDWWISKSIAISGDWIGRTVDVVECGYEMDDLSYSVTAAKTGSAVRLNTNTRARFSFVNDYRRTAVTLTVEKQISGSDTSGSFPFTVSYTATEPESGEELSSSESFELTNGGVQHIANIPIGAEVTLTETSHGGFTTAIYCDGTQVSDSDTYTFTITENTALTVYNTMGVRLPETGGTTPYLFIYGGLLLMLLAVVAGWILRRRWTREGFI